jgi:cyclopropane-fatty-acyl-phospholipid synthase
VTGGDVALGESYMDGDWSSPDLTAVVRVAVRHKRRKNTADGSRKNIFEHYDLSYDFFQLLL